MSLRSSLSFLGSKVYRLMDAYLEVASMPYSSASVAFSLKDRGSNLSHLMSYLNRARNEVHQLEWVTNHNECQHNVHFFGWFPVCNRSLKCYPETVSYLAQQVSPRCNSKSVKHCGFSLSMFMDLMWQTFSSLSSVICQFDIFIFP